MSSEFGSLSKRGILPDGKLILSISVGRNNFLARAIFRPGQLGHLRSGVDRVGANSGGGVPESFQVEFKLKVFKLKI